MIKESWKQKGFVDEPIPAGTDLAAEIRRMCREKNAIILSHYYTPGDVQDVADFVGDSLALAQKAAKTDADIIVMCGVHFMAETNKILCPDKTVLIPDLNAQCSLAESCPPDKFAKFVEEHPGYTVLSYVNTSAAIKALTDVVRKILLTSIEEEMVHTGDIVRWQELLTKKNKVQKMQLHMN